MKKKKKIWKPWSTRFFFFNQRKKWCHLWFKFAVILKSLLDLKVTKKFIYIWKRTLQRYCYMLECDIMGVVKTKMVFVMPNVWSLDNRYLPQLLAGLPEPEKMVKPNLFLPFMLCDEPSPKLFSITCHSAESEQAVKWGYFTHPTDLARAQYHHLEEDACADTHTDTDHTHIHLTVCFLSVPPNSSFDPEGENSEV